MAKRKKVHQTKTSCRYRQFEPKQCVKGSFRNKKVSPDTNIILCKKKGSKKQSVQSIIKKRKTRTCPRTLKKKSK